jgi:hypothetical protein
VLIVFCVGSCFLGELITLSEESYQLCVSNCVSSTNTDNKGPKNKAKFGLLLHRNDVNFKKQNLISLQCIF